MTDEDSRESQDEIRLIYACVARMQLALEQVVASMEDIELERAILGHDLDAGEGGTGDQSGKMPLKLREKCRQVLGVIATARETMKKMTDTAVAGREESDTSIMLIHYWGQFEVAAAEIERRLLEMLGANGASGGDRSRSVH